MIPDDAVDAAALTAFERDYGVDDWTIVHPQIRARYMDSARAVLEAAAPHLEDAAYQRPITRKPAPIYPLGKIEDKRR